MEWLTDEIIFYSGIVLAVMSGIAMVIYIFIAKAKEDRINIQLTKEYGDPKPSLKEKQKCQK